ncbi:MAG: DNA polymerase I, partial [Candidatus Omnitrophica bacterium]|nr:DNA polymerase I [Candidatus Omnitrophota bacterium]
MKGRLFLIDGSSFCYRAFYAVRELTTSRGQPTNAIFGVVTMLRKLMEEERPEYLAVAFDLPEPTFRHERYEAYKEHRLPMPEGLVSQLPWIKEVLKAHRIPIFEEAGFEADDLLGTLAQRAEKKGLEVMLVTGDKDALQLLSGKIKVYRPTREGHEIIDTDSLRLKWNLRPDQVVELMSLMGDATDNIPGVSGIGEKTALQLIGQFQSVGELLKHLEEVRPSVAAKIREHKEQLELSRELATIDTQVPLKIDWQALKAQEPDLPALRRLFQELEFRSLARDLPGEAPAGRCPEVRTISGEELPGVLPEILEAQTAAVVVGETGAALSWREGSAA